MRLPCFAEVVRGRGSRKGPRQLGLCGFDIELKSALGPSYNFFAVNVVVKVALLAPAAHKAA